MMKPGLETEGSPSLESDSVQASSEMEGELQKRQRNYQIMLKKLEVLGIKRIQEEDECENLRSVLAREYDKKQQLKKKLVNIRNQVCGLRKKNESLCAATKEKVEIAEQELSQAEEERENYNEVLAKARKQLHELQAELRLETENTKTLDDKRTSLKKQSQKAQNLLKSEQGKLDEIKSVIKILEPQVVGKKSELCSLTQKLAIAQEQKKLTDTQAGDAEERLVKLREDARKLRTDKSTTEEALLCVKCRLKCQQKELDSTKQKCRVKRKEQKWLKSRISEREVELRKLQERQHKCFVCELPTLQQKVH